MPSLEISKKDLEALAGKKFRDRDALEEALMYAKTELDSLEGDVIKCSPSDSNRPDLYSTEGIARELAAKMGVRTGIRAYKASKARHRVIVEKTVEKIRPLLVGAIVRNIHVTEPLLVQMTQLQEKICQTYGRRRREAAIGIYDLDRMKMPVYYKGMKDNEIEFIPLEYRVPMRPREILSEHPKGKEYAPLLEGTDRYPILIDSAGVVASMPPIINSQHTGKVTPQTKNLFIEVTGFSLAVCETALEVVLMALSDRGGEIERLDVEYPTGAAYPKGPMSFPRFATRTTAVRKQLIADMTGLSLDDAQVLELLARCGFDAKTGRDAYTVTYPAYRQDILHAVDIVEDLLVAYGYNRIPLQALALAVRGHKQPDTLRQEFAAEGAVGMGCQEVLTYYLTSAEKQTRHVRVADESFARIANPVSTNYEIFRKRLYPELLEFLSKNKQVTYPQKIFETGKVIEPDPKTDTGAAEPLHLCIAIADQQTDFTDIKRHAVALADYLGEDAVFESTEHPSFEKGKAATVRIGKKRGVVGEVSREVLRNFGLKTPVSVLEVEI
jgi:phenylalanyl-tRNA synthetase beta chain